MYPSPTRLQFDFGDLERRMEGAFREGHFNGVATIVSKLFHLVNPNKAYFGQKDLQQFMIVKALVEDLFFDIELRCCPIVREKDGLAMSSRNVRLDAQARPQANQLYQALLLGQKALKQENQSLVQAKEMVKQHLQAFEFIELEYFEVVNSENLQPIQSLKEASQISLCIAAYLGEIRLIDNLFC